eukprot:CAMPEP_0201538434 /NCGR_PEP_ID=MMETSP0161_2-20130828/67591_1 /ASSEMBLY_ACC=CAM_ASM_000251 /TAXON_ID=180227 /ORGANISM="Neoparamoeba aestuarina, Strain SoJaBio B1-5/56/2" /LENGTH=147 /DNA_ID=CAMNT_0047945269 /DNA_START=32 /DNA_END=472 /DNA_ORIENTATION=-
MDDSQDFVIEEEKEDDIVLRCVVQLRACQRAKNCALAACLIYTSLKSLVSVLSSPATFFQYGGLEALIGLLQAGLQGGVVGQALTISLTPANRDLLNSSSLSGSQDFSLSLSMSSSLSLSSSGEGMEREKEVVKKIRWRDGESLVEE